VRSGVDARLRAGHREQSERELRIELPCDTTAPASARAALRDLAASLPGPAGRGGGSLRLDWIIGDAVLVASELVTETVLHSGCAPDGTLALVVTAAPRRLLVSVQAGADSAEADRGHPGESASHAASGDIQEPTPLRIVERLSRQWGRSDDGRAVWAELALPGQLDARSHV
jgi:hypothetical protein